MTTQHTFKHKKALLGGLLFAACIGAKAQNSDTTITQKEEDYYTIQTLPIPENVKLEVGGMTLLPNDALAVSTRHGEVWKISNPYMKNGGMPRYSLFAEGMHETLGLNYIKGDLYLAQRSELTRLRDLDGDGRADEYETIYTWPLSGNYHEYSYGPKLDKDGNMILTLNLSWIGYGESLTKWRGWMIKISPEGKFKPFATGFRSPAGFGLNNNGDIFYAENQGDWVGSGSITNVAEGDFVGNPGGLRWSGEPNSPVKLKKQDIPDTGEPKYEVAKRVPGLKTPAVWFPHTILGISTSDILSYEGAAKMGPFEGQLFVGDQGQSKIMRVSLEKVKGVYQGVVFPFREGFSSGIIRMCWGSDGSMFVGMTARGWGATGGKEYGLQRLVWNEKTPFEMKTVSAKPDGFEIEFTQPVDEKAAKDVNSYQITSFTYKYHHIYGSPVINQGDRKIKAIEISPDKLKVRLVLDSLKLGYIHEIKTEGVRSSNKVALLHNTGYYTLNNIPDGDNLKITAQNQVTTPMSHHDHMNMGSGGTSGAVVAKAVTVKHLTKQPADWGKPDRTITIGTKPGLKFDTDNLTVKAGSKIKLTFKNSDDMLHNIVFVKPGTSDKVGQMAVNMGLNGEKLSFIPNTPNVLFHTILLHPKEADTIYFTAPDKPGTYPFLCSYPGHYLVMKGVMKVVAE
jgi:azurin/glucose/arabinose dehydrogenase